jgi:hypothetical protein
MNESIAARAKCVCVLGSDRIAVTPRPRTHPPTLTIDQPPTSHG